MVANLRNNEAWDNRDAVVSYLAEQARKGRLLLCLGSGVSVPFGLPNWEELLDELAGDRASEMNSDDVMPSAKAEFLLKEIFYENHKDLIAKIREIFYAKRVIGIGSLKHSELLLGIIALLSIMARNKPAKIISTNYDTLVEDHLKLFGMRVQSTDTHQIWNPICDVICYHPHGIIRPTEDGSSGEIVLTTKQFDTVMKDADWRGLLSSMLQSHTVLFLGVSGEDPHIMSLAHSAFKKHAIRNSGWPFFGLRLDAASRKKIVQDVDLEKAGYRSFYVSDYSDIPNFLFEICAASNKI